MKASHPKIVLISALVLLFAIQGLSQEKSETIWGNYRFTSDAEVGWRWRELHGSVDKFRSDINLGRGPRLFGFSLDSDSLNHSGFLYDHLHMDSSGWGGDPNTWTRLRLEKNKIYKFTMSYRQYDYYNFLPTFALFQHDFDITRRMSDVALTLFPESSVKLHFGYGRNTSYGPSFTTSRFGFNEFLLFEPLRRENNDYRMGVDWKFKNTVLSYEQGFRTFKNDRHLFQSAPFGLGNNPTSGTSLNRLDGLQPIRGFIPVEKFGLRSKFLKKFDFTGQFAYSRARIDLKREGFVSGVDAPSTRITRAIATDGLSTKPNPLLDSGLTYRVTKKLTISDTFRFNRFGIIGTAVENVQETQNNRFGIGRSFTSDRVFDRFLGVKSSSNLLNVEYALTPGVALRLGYRFLHRVITEDTAVGDLVGSRTSSESVTRFNTHTGILGVSLRAWKKANLFADYENGTSDNGYTRISPFHVRNWRVRAQYKPLPKVSVNGSFVRRYSDVPLPLATNRFRNTGFSASGSWLPSERFVLNVGYNRMDINTEAGILFFLSGALNQGRSFYASNTNFVFGDALIGITKRLDLFIGYRLLKDVGTDRLPVSPSDFVNAFPLSFHQPSAHVSFKINRRLRWNVGYDHYSYNEKQFSIQDYRAHIVYTSLGVGF